MGVVGGLRARLIHDNFVALVRDGLDSLGWFAPGRAHLPLRFITQPNDWDEPIELNSIAVSNSSIGGIDAELGSLLSEESWDFFIDLYAQSDAVGLHIIHDVRDILRGKMPSIGRDDPSFDVMNLTLATPVKLFSCEIEDVVVDRANGFNKPWQRYWYSCRATVIDTYLDESD